MTHGSTISASTSVEKGRSSVWGVSLSLFGALLIFYGFLTGLMFTMETVNPTVILFAGIISMLALILVTSIAKSAGDEKSVKSALDGMSSWGAINVIMILFMLFIFNVKYMKSKRFRWTNLSANNKDETGYKP